MLQVLDGNSRITPEQFAYWLQGFAELSGGPPTAEQWQSIKDHLTLVFVKATPPMPNYTTLPVTLPTWPEKPMEVTCKADTSSIAIC